MNEPNIEYKVDNDGNPTMNVGKMQLAELYSSKLVGDDFNTFIKSIEKLIRTSQEYSMYIANVFSNYGISNCAILGHANNIEIELHHYPYTLYDLVRIECCRYIIDKIPLTTFSVAMDVINFHLTNLVSFVPLSITAHQAAHSGKIFIPLSMVYGKTNEFNSLYAEYIPEDLKIKFNEIVTKTNNNELDIDIFIID